jgi:3-oxoacyl-[acyl-carrier protein] reductase
MIISQKNAIVTGASRGLGAALASSLVAKGAQVYGLARDATALKTLQDKLGKMFVPVEMDITDQTAIASWVERTFSGQAGPDILINNAGAGYFSNTDTLPLERWHQMIDTNLNGTFYLTAKVIPLMKRKTAACHIINVGSILGKTTHSSSAAYSATKYGLQGFSEALSKELRGHKIKVTCVNPGSIATRFFEDSGVEPHENMLQPDDIAALIVHILETPDNFLIDELSLRPLLSNPPQSSQR